MPTSPWINHLGESSENPKLLAALEKLGVQQVPVIEKNSTTARIQMKTAMLIFSAGELFPELDEGGDGTSVLSGVLLPIKRKWGDYEGDLPHELQRDDSRDKLRARLGEPVKSDDDFCWDEWRVDNRTLRVAYANDFARLASVGVELVRKT